MATVEKVHGSTQAAIQIGRQMDFAVITVTGDLTASPAGTSELYLDDVRRVIDQYASITIIGTATATAVVFGIKGGDVLDIEGDQTYATIEAAINGIATLSGATVVIQSLQGAVLA